MACTLTCICIHFLLVLHGTLGLLSRNSSFDAICKGRLFIPSGRPTALMTEGGWLLLPWKRRPVHSVICSAALLSLVGKGTKEIMVIVVNICS